MRGQRLQAQGDQNRMKGPRSDSIQTATDTKAPQLSRLTAQTGLPSNALAAIRQVVCNDPSVESVNKVVLFGSRAKGTWRSGSDIDLAVFGTGLTFQDTARWKDLLEERLFPWTVDVIAPSLVHDSAVLDHIERVGIVLWSS